MYFVLYFSNKRLRALQFTSPEKRRFSTVFKFAKLLVSLSHFGHFFPLKGRAFIQNGIFIRTGTVYQFSFQKNTLTSKRNTSVTFNAQYSLNSHLILFTEFTISHFDKFPY